ncbi:MAG: ATP-binding protein [Pseudomonadota bacterium]
MKLAQRLQIYLILFGALGIGLAGMQYWINQQFSESVARIDSIVNISFNVSRITALTDEVGEYPDEERPVRQWLAVYGRISELLTDPALASYHDTLEMKLIQEAHQNMGAHFQRLHAFSNTKLPADSAASAKRRIVSATNIAAQTIVDNVASLRKTINQQQQALYDRALYGFTLLVVLTLIIALLFFRLSNRRITEAIANLEQGISRVGEGHLDTQIPLVGDHELQHLGKALNRMLEMLRQTTASKESLETVVNARTASLQKSRLAAISLMEDSNLQRKQLTQAKQSLEQEIEHRKEKERDLTEKKEALKIALNAAEAANRAKSVFLASMSHELRTPLNAVLGFSSLMRRDAKLSTEQRNTLDIINRSGAHLLTLINDVLEMAKIEAGRVQIENTSFDLGIMVRDVTDMMHMRAEEKGLRMLIDQSSDFPRYIKCDEARLRQVLINLIGNAIKFTEQGGVTIRFGMKPHDTPPHLLIEVEDSGPGISAEDQKKLFQPFVQLGKLPGDNKGTGLGLTITRQFVELMGGVISVDSAPGKGSTFRVELSVDKAEAADLVKMQAAVAAEATGLVPGQPAYRVLIVEDQLENQLLLKQLMDSVGIQAQVANDGKQGVELFQSWQPHLILMDQRMPVMDGIEATKAIRKLPGGDKVKIVAVTASVFKEQQEEMMAAGLDDFMRKPYRFNEIYDCLTKQLGVQYTYATAQKTETAPPVALTAEMLAAMPSALRSKLREALVSLDSERIDAIIGQVSIHDASLHKTLSRLADNFDYPTILKALEDTPK